MAGNLSIEQARRNVDAARQAGNRAREAGAQLDLGAALASNGLAVEASEAFEDAAAAARDTGDQELTGRALANAGSQLHLAGQHPDALRVSHEAIANFRGLGDRRSELRTLANCAMIERALGRPDEAIVSVGLALALAKDLDDRELTPALHSLHAELLAETGKSGGSRTARQQAVQAARRVGDPLALAAALESLGEQLIGEHAYDEAVKVYFEVVGLHRTARDVGGVYRCTLQLGLIYQHTGRWAESQSSLKEAATLGQQLGDAARQPYIKATLASVMVLASKDFDEAASLALEAARGYHQLDDRLGAGRSLATRGQALEGLGRTAEARQVFEDALEQLNGIDPEGESALRALLAS